ncbi:acetylornithine and succinylornithine aminotransferase [Hydrogenobacter thermophilus TK-6]|uniref:Acetylornithine aminotransferase n=1 Tax=Hydrogenobacter thermophilus (strain DSM 6534 / IAM 12695 / TK-6) TaxID=608538 RepID=D3DGD6_HYDTT|nr:aspartate aminotransferase family protein [Hydrogenobacter thermophilus]ADO44824.1 acetylornithine and succinylornithine aminotransferase [Hydrogenobacter thermophilus TK-6]BAI68888.1 acetylornithine and succinylornithine aminotransferase [Hydrogenobacter thermophilus TK-6]
MYVMETYTRLPVSFVRGEGVYLFDQEGRKYLDLVAGIAVNALGYNHKDLIDAICEQSQRLMHVSNLFENPWQEEVAKMLIEKFWTKGRVFFCNSGTEANEAAIKLVRKYFKEKGENRYRIITFYNSFHGRTFGSMSATAQEKVQKGFEPLLEGFDYAIYNSFDSVLKALRKDTAGIMLEVIQGEGGIRVANYEFIQKVQELCHNEGLLLIVDEVQTGVGRTGKFFAYEHFDLKPDIITLAKGLGGGFPVGAVIAREKVSEVFSPGSHGSTFGGNPLACACAKVVINKVSELLHHVSDVGEYFKRGLERLKVGKVRGMGLMLGLDLERDCSTIVRKALEHRLVINCTAGTVLRFVPPLIIQKDHINTGLAVLDRILKAR